MHNLNQSYDQLINNIMLMENKIDKIFSVNHMTRKQGIRQKRQLIRLKNSLLNDLKDIYKD